MAKSSLPVYREFENAIKRATRQRLGYNAYRVLFWAYGIALEARIDRGGHNANA